MSFAEAKQTERKVSIAWDISWTYSLDLVDSLELGRLFRLCEIWRMFPLRRMKKESDGSRRNGDTVTVKKAVWCPS